MSDLKERLRAQIADDHDRGCQGRNYGCTCGYDERTEELLAIAANEIERLEHNQMSHGYTSLAQAAALQAQEADARAGYAKKLEHKCEQFTKALMTSMHLIDQLVTENGRLCAASNTPPPLQLFTAKRNFEVEMKKLLGEDESAREEKSEVESDNHGETG